MQIAANHASPSPFALSLSKGLPERSEGPGLASARQKASTMLSLNGLGDNI